MTVIRVRHKSSAAACYYTHAQSAAEAVERVTLALGDVEGLKAWDAEPNMPAFEVAERGVFDRSGARVIRLA